MRSPEHPRLAAYAEMFAALKWAVMICDDEWRLVWVSDELREFLRADEDTDLGIGLHIAEACLKGAWLSGISPESLASLFSDIGPYLLSDLEQRGRKVEDVLPTEMIGFLDGMGPIDTPEVFKTRFFAVDPADQELPPYPVNVGAMQVRDDDGTPVGLVVLMFMDVRPNLMALLARGDEEMYERMARLADPRARQGAILFCDLQSSGLLSRQLPSMSYFRLVRELWTGIDQAVADNTGIVGKHAGDGASAFFLVDEIGSASEAAGAALKTAARIHEFSEQVFSGVVEGDCPMRIGLHWGGTLYMGQLVPGSRLDITALGDAVNETARIQEAAAAGETIVSKQLLEQLAPDDAAGLGINLEKISYRLLEEVAPDAHKVIRDAGGVPVTRL
jgi:class 3 adenylate cyclase